MSDVFATIGGLLSSLGLVTGQVFGIYIITFLWRLTDVVLTNMKVNYKTKSIEFFDKLIGQFSDFFQYIENEKIDLPFNTKK